MKLRVLAASAVALALPLHADRLVTTDGRVLELKKARELPDGNYHLVFEGGEILCPKAFVASVEIEGDMADYVPANEDEKKKLAQGFVRYRGKWLSKPAYKAELERTAEASRARTAELAAHAQFYDGWKKETEHFAFESNTSPEILEAYAELLEGYYDLMDKRVGIAPAPILKKKKMRVCIYKNRPEFTELTKSAPGVAGFFNFQLGELHFYHDYEDPSVSTWVALHEGTHLLTFLIEPQALPQIWINEGVADYFGSATVTRNKKGKLEIQPGEISLERILTVQQAIDDGSVIPLERLFELSREEFQAFEYAHAWSFVYFLNTAKPEYEKAFRKFFKALYTLEKGVAVELLNAGGNQYGSWKVVAPKEVRRLLLEKLGRVDVPALEQEWKAFLRALPIDAPVARYKRGLYALQVVGGKEVLPKALEDLDAALAGGVEEPRAFWARSLLRLVLRGDEKGAEEDLRAAVERAPLAGGYRANLAQLLAGLSLHTNFVTIQRSAEEQEKLSDSKARIEEAQRQFELAVALEPESDPIRESRRLFLELLEKKP